MKTQVTFNDIVSQFRATFRAFPDNRLASNNTRYSMEDAGICAFSVFFLQCASFLEYQQRMQENQGRNNAQTLFGAHNIPCDNQIRHLLDNVPPSAVFPAYHFLFDYLRDENYLEKWQFKPYGYLLALDGTQQFSSSTIHCEHCLTKQHRNGTTTYSHQVLTPILTTPEREQVIPLPPAFITQQDGTKKQDCEINAAKRWLNDWGKRYFPLGITILGDDLYCHEPFCREVKALGGHFILTCKPKSHKTLYEWLDSLGKTDGIQTHKIIRKMGRHHVTDTYRLASDVPLLDSKDALLVNWCELESVRDDGKVLYKNAFATSHPVQTNTVVELVRAGRCRWKIENENNNTLKTKGYHFEHNFGHGKQHLANLLTTMALLAYFTHTVLALIDECFSELLAKRTRKRLFDDIDTLTSYFCFKNWEAMLDFIKVGLVRKHRIDEIQRWILK